jgi:ATP-binding cassette, subfamily B, bacterial
VKAFLTGFLAASILCGFAASDASAARKRSTGNNPRPPQDSVLSIPRVAQPPDLVEFLRRAEHGKRVAKIEREPDGAKPGSSRPDTTQETPAKAQPDSLLGQPTGLEPKEEEPAKPQPDSLLVRPAGLEPEQEDPATSYADSMPGQPASLEPMKENLANPKPDSLLNPPRNLVPRNSSRPSSSTRSRAKIVSGGALPPPAPGPPAITDVPPDPSPPSRSPRGPLPVWPFVVGSLFVVGAVIQIVWVAAGRLRAPGRRSARQTFGEFTEAAANGSNGYGASPRPSAAPRVASAAGMAVARGPSRVRRMFLSNLLRVKRSLLLAALFMVGGAAVELLKPWPLKIILDHVILAKPLSGALSFLQGIAPGGPGLLVAASASIVLISVVGGLFSYFQVFITKALGYRMVYALRREVFAHLQRLSLSFHNRARTGDLLTTFSKDTDTLKNVFAEALLRFADQFLSMIGMLTIMWFVNWKTCLVAVATLPFLCFTLMHLYRQTKMSLKKQRKQEGKVVSRLNEVLRAVSMVQAFGRERHEEERYEATSNETLRESIRMTRLEAAATRSSYIMSAIGTALVVLVGGMEVIQGRMLPGELVLVMSYVTSMYKPLRNLAKLSIECSKAAASAERIAEVLEIEPEIQDRPDAIEADDVRGAIHFAAVSFDYGDGKEVLRDVSFDVAPGQRVALIGVSGAGKSTIASLILRLYEAQGGVILIDGVDITRYRRESLRRRIGIVLQESLLFGATIQENIAYGKPDASLEDIVAAARTANADEFIRELEDGYDSVVGERGVTLSAGQRQRIAIARAVVRDPRILLLDEPMTGLDAESEIKVREALDRLMVGRTSIIITHDLPSIADAHQVLVLDEGRIVERGTYAKLMRRKGRYRALFDLSLQPATPQVAKR